MAETTFHRATRILAAHSRVRLDTTDDSWICDGCRARIANIAATEDEIDEATAAHGLRALAREGLLMLDRETLAATIAVSDRRNPDGTIGYYRQADAVLAEPARTAAALPPRSAEPCPQRPTTRATVDGRPWTAPASGGYPHDRSTTTTPGQVPANRGSGSGRQPADAEARLAAQRAATDAWKARAEELGERLDEAMAANARMEEL